MSKKRLATTGIAIALASAVAMSPAVASSTEPEGPQVLSVSGVDLSAWDLGGGVLNLVLGPKKCSVVANLPFQSANQVKGRGSVTCNNPYGLLTLEVCVQVRATADGNGFTWQNAGCQPLKAAKDVSTLSDTATAPCATEAASYRTLTHAQGFVDDGDTDPAFDGTIVSDSIAFDCGL